MFLRKAMVFSIGILLISSVVCSADTGNLLANGGFEYKENDLPKSWSQTGNGSFALDKVVACNGDCSLSITATSDSVEPSVRQKIILEPARYRFTAYYRADSKETAEHTRVQMMLLRDDEHYKIKPETEDEVVVSSSSGTKASIYWDFLWVEPEVELVKPNQWQRLEAILDFSNFDPMVMMVELKLWRKAGTLWWDDVSIVKLTD